MKRPFFKECQPLPAEKDLGDGSRWAWMGRGVGPRLTLWAGEGCELSPPPSGGTKVSVPCAPDLSSWPRGHAYAHV